MSTKPQYTITKDGFHACRITVGRQRRFVIRTTDVNVFYARHARLTEIARALTRRGIVDDAVVIIEKACEQDADDFFEHICKRADKLAPPAAKVPGRWSTFGEFAAAYLAGDVARKYPGHCKAPNASQIKDDSSRLKALLPVVGEVPLVHFTKDHAMLAMGALPPTTKRDRTRNHYWQVMHHYLALACNPCGLITHNPLLREHRPKHLDGDIAYPFLYPEEVFAMARYDGPAECQGVELGGLEMRVFVTGLTIEGPRIGEWLRGLTWSRINELHSRVGVGMRKNGKVGVWPAQPGTIEALLALGRMIPELAELPGPFYRLPDDDKWAERVQALVRAAIAHPRPELVERSEGAGWLRGHDTRATMITLAKALDLPESWITRRSGHETSSMLARYDHSSGDWKEQGLGKLVRLDVAVGLMALGLPPLTADQIAETAGRVPVSVDSEDGETETETTRHTLVRATVPKKWFRSRFDAGTEDRTRTGTPSPAADFESAGSASERPGGRASARNPVAGTSLKPPTVLAAHGPARQISEPPDRDRSGPHLANVGSSPGSVGSSADPYLDGLRRDAAAAVARDDWSAARVIAGLIEQRLAATAASVAVAPATVSPAATAGSPSVAAPVLAVLDEATRRPRGRTPAR